MIQGIGDCLYNGADAVLVIFGVYEMESDLRHSAPEELDATMFVNCHIFRYAFVK